MMLPLKHNFSLLYCGILNDLPEQHLAASITSLVVFLAMCGKDYWTFDT